MLLNNKNAIITGSNRGMGKSIAEVFAENGANIWACARQADEAFETFCQDISRRFSVWVKPIYFDLTDETSRKEALKEINTSKERVDVLVNNAGMASENRLFQMMTQQQLRQTFEVNFFAQMALTQGISRLMMRQKSGSIINMASAAAMDGDPAQLDYVASKAALIGATKKLARELGVAGIRVNAIAPSLTETEMADQMSPQLREKSIETTILKRMAKPREVANAVLFLASDLSSYITGQVLRVDGGMG